MCDGKEAPVPAIPSLLENFYAMGELQVCWKSMNPQSAPPVGQI